MLTVDFDRLRMEKNDLILDAGCGEGRHSFESIARGGRVISMDTDMESLRKARYTLVDLGKGFTGRSGSFLIHSGDALNLPFRDGTFDKIICAEVMEHVSDDFHACSELSRVLKSNGRIAITVPTYISEWIYDVCTYEYFTSPGGHIRKYVPRKLADIMERNSLRVYDLDFRHAFHTVYWLIRCVVGLHDEGHPMTRGYRNFLSLGMGSKFMNTVERILDNFFPKSIILYAVKTEDAPRKGSG